MAGTVITGAVERHGCRFLYPLCHKDLTQILTQTGTFTANLDRQKTYSTSPKGSK
jgi:hypothetical protein